jgi:hypothetical protein
MKVKRLEGIPTSGDYDEIIFDLDGPWKGDKWNYALFTTSNYDEWLGMFRDKDLANFKVAELSNGTACIISGGHGFVVDIDKRTRRKDLKTERIIDIISDNETESFFISTWYSLTRVTKHLDEIDIILPIQADGIYFNGVKGRKLNLEIEEIGADMKKTKDYFLDLTEMAVKKHEP